MLKTNIKKLFLTLIVSILLIAFGNASTLQVTEAKYSPVNRKVCSLAVAPYNPESEAIIGLAADPYLNYLSNDTCNKFVKLYGNAYAPQPPKAVDNPLKPGSEYKNVPTIRHDHAYYNDTEHDANFYYKSFVDRFEITLQSDGFKNIDLDKLECQTPYPTNYAASKLSELKDCSGTLSDLWGGTTLTKKTVGNTMVITWDFGQTDQNGKFIGQSQVWANNGKNFDQGDFTDENKRKLPFNIHLPTKNNDDTWSATTTSKVLVADLAINKTNYAAHKNDGCKNNDVNDPGSGWCYIDPTDNEPTKNFPTETVFTAANHTFYWYNIGSVATVWQKTVQPNVCQSLTASLDPKTININGNTAYHININKITFTPKNEIPADAKLKLTSTDDSKGEFWILSPMAGVEEMASPYVKIGTGTATTFPANTKIYYIGTKPTKVKIELVDIPASQLGTTCYGYVFIPIEEKECKNILVDHPKKIYEGTVSVFKANALDTDYKDFPGKIKYWVDPGYGEFYVIKPKNIPDNPSEYVYEATPTSATVPVPNYKIDPGIIIAGNTPETAIGAIVNIATALATGTFGIETLSANLPNQTQIQDFAFKNLIEVPSWMETGLKPNINPIDPTPTETGGSFFNPNFGMNSLLALNFGNFDIQPAINPDVTIENLTPDTTINTPYYITSLFESVTVDPGATVYFWAKKPGKNVVHVKTVNSNVKECRRDFDIEPKPQLLCKELNVVTNTKGDLVTGQPALININPKDTANIKLPPTTKFKISTTTDGKFQNVAGNNLGNTALLTDFPIYLVNATTAGTVTVKIDNTDPAYAAICAAEVKVKVSPQNQCTAKNYTLVEYGGTDKTNLEKGKMYKVSASLSTTIPNENTITYSINNNYGAFVKADQALYPAIKTALSNPPINNIINLTTLSQAFGANSVASQLTVAENTTVILITFSDPANSLTSKTDALTIQGSGYGNPECIKYVPFVVPAEVKECKNILLNPAFNPNAGNGTIINILGDYKDHNGDVKVTITSNTTGAKPSISKIGGTENQELILTKADIQSNVAKSFIYNKNNYNENTDTLTLTVEAIGSLAADCKKIFNYPAKTVTKECIDLDITKPSSPWEIDGEDEQDFEIDVDSNPASYATDELYYNWEVIDGDGEWQNDDEKISKKGDLTQTLENFEEGTKVKVWASTSEFGSIVNICSETITAEEAKKEKGPKIAKYAYPENQIHKADDILNINGDTNYITYMLVFDANDVKSVDLWDEALKKYDGVIKNPGSQTDGNLQFTEMKIDVLKTNGKGETLFKTENYKENSKKSGKAVEFADENFSNTSNYEENECNDQNNSICLDIEAKNISNTFGTGDKIHFKNLDKDSVDKLIIKYQMVYKKKLTDDICKNLVGVCGEQFKNEAKYDDAISKSGKEFASGSASAKVIAICPYILTRQGGDVFFHDVIDTGVDVAQCSEVKSCDGPCITPEPPQKKIINKTGSGDIPDEIKLELPSHDVCRYSNLGSNLEGYNNVLKNFSSTICELRADVSKAWTKKNINESIAANVKRISRWEENLTNSNISNTSQLNSTSGVFVRKSGDLTIGGLSDYIIGGNESVSVPAAQTYIVIGHDLHITSDIKYAPLGIAGYSKIKTIPSAAFIVIDGNIIIDSSVKQIDGVLMAVDLDGFDTDGQNIDTNDNTDGKVKANGYTNENTLTINGNLIGDVNDLFSKRRAVGDPRKDEGSVTIRYDERILLNTPPGINELINVQQAIVP